ncbi:hypothetical protein BO83DRAFT_114811 [Aspergillus eucalypticola CBS 122712]|uniref:Uncharacterized protein n=1 Tax=Aspergillus eucalypticola (strain CBS 122712 / IBT 29274) TaxID=1448314 RepID=A0A317UWA6_ASPEC|nr:uncharacterized protein BO83DRAFT_114811 [Aspergillus eucalypticola CBS 122712]PWY66324.1 hypothetical protein BO83DRAFT_114811 [Aspergillus eucalypticola CBS 122712]
MEESSSFLLCNFNNQVLRPYCSHFLIPHTPIQTLVHHSLTLYLQDTSKYVFYLDDCLMLCCLLPYRRRCLLRDALCLQLSPCLLPTQVYTGAGITPTQFYLCFCFSVLPAILLSLPQYQDTPRRLASPRLTPIRIKTLYSTFHQKGGVKHAYNRYYYISSRYNMMRMMQSTTTRTNRTLLWRALEVQRTDTKYTKYLCTLKTDSKKSVE